MEASKPQLTFVMVVEYDGSAYAGFQRQSPTDTLKSSGPNKSSPTSSTHAAAMPTPVNDADDVTCVGTENRESRHPHDDGINGGYSEPSREEATRPQKRRRKGHPPQTVQQVVEEALMRWTCLTMSALRVRAAGRTDKGVHASGQVVAFDVPWPWYEHPRPRDDDPSVEASVVCLAGEACSSLAASTAPLPRPGAASTESQTNRDGWLSIPGDGAVADGDASVLDGAPPIHAGATDAFWKMRRAINTRLPADVCVRSVSLWKGGAASTVEKEGREGCRKTFEARERVSLKRYTYRVRFRTLAYLTLPTESDESDNGVGGENESNKRSRRCRLGLHPICRSGPHLLRRATDRSDVWMCPWPLDPDALTAASKAMQGHHDFTNFVHKSDRHAGGKSHMINLATFRVVIEKGEQYKQWGANGDCPESLAPVCDATFVLEAKGFRRSMVRNLVGFSVDIARGSKLLRDVRVVLLEKKPEVGQRGDNWDEKEVSSMVHSAPGCGLCLCRVEYEDPNDFFHG